MSEHTFCDRKEWCVLQNGHKGDCRATFDEEPPKDSKKKETTKQEIPYVVGE